jgi:hypothetical protein
LAGNLAWPDVLSSIAFLIKITEDMANATRLYSTLMEDKLNAKKFYDTNDLTFYTQEVKSKTFVDFDTIVFYFLAFFNCK